MTIKKGGGIFGRNPTFNNVDVDGTLNIGGNAVPDTTTILVDGDIGSSVQGYDADTTKNDVANTFTANQIINASLGIGVSPATVFHAKGSITVATVESTAANGDIQIKGSGTTGYTAIRANAENLLFLTEATQRLRIDSDGLKFGTDSAAANALDDYEEGAFDITITPETSGSITVTTGFNSLVYTKVGRVVHISGGVGLSGTSSPVGTYVTIAGLPFTMASLGENQEYAGFATFYIDDNTSSRSLLPSLYFSGTSFRAYIDASTIQPNDTFAFNFTYIAT